MSGPAGLGVGAAHFLAQPGGAAGAGRATLPCTPFCTTATIRCGCNGFATRDGTQPVPRSAAGRRRRTAPGDPHSLRDRRQRAGAGAGGKRPGAPGADPRTGQQDGAEDGARPCRGKLTMPPASSSAAPGLEADITAALTGDGASAGARRGTRFAPSSGRPRSSPAAAAEREQEVLRRAVARLSSLTSERAAPGADPDRGSG